MGKSMQCKHSARYLVPEANLCLSDSRTFLIVGSLTPAIEASGSSSFKAPSLQEHNFCLFGMDFSGACAQQWEGCK